MADDPKDQNPPAAPAGPTHFMAKAHLDVIREGKNGKKAQTTFAPGIVPAAKLTPEEVESFTRQGVLEPVAFSAESPAE